MADRNLSLVRVLRRIILNNLVIPQNYTTFAAVNVKEIENKKIAVLLSGGVDSSVVLYELVKQGLQPDCFYIKIGPEEK
jgi:tRNA-specific 2-thiouridylase